MSCAKPPTNDAEKSDYRITEFLERKCPLRYRYRKALGGFHLIHLPGYIFDKVRIRMSDDIVYSASPGLT